MQTKEIYIPVVCLSSRTREDAEIKGLQLGAVEYLRKPVQADLLMLPIKNIFNK